MTDPITHFKHLGGHTAGPRPAKKCGYKGVGAQTWTWSQDPKVIESYESSRPAFSKQKWAVGADGQRYFNMFGCEDLLPAATREYIKSDRPANPVSIAFNDRESLPYFLREGEAQKRPVHEYWRSDRIWAAMRDEATAPAMRDEASQPRFVGKQRDEIRERSLSSEDEESLEWRSSSTCRRSQYKENSPPERLPTNNFVSRRRHPGEFESQKNLAWMPVDAPQLQPPMDLRVPGLSMTPRAVSQRDAIPRSMMSRGSWERDSTPRSSTPCSSAAQDRRLRRSASAASGPSQRDAACQVTARDEMTPRGMTPRGSTPRGGGDRSVTPRGARSVTPRGDRTPRAMTPRSNILQGGAQSTPRGDRTPRAMTPRGSTPQDVVSLSMMPQLITRRDLMPGCGTPRGSAASGGSRRGMRRSASEVAINRNLPFV